jgi:CspA family cold shock protein
MLGRVKAMRNRIANTEASTDRGVEIKARKHKPGHSPPKAAGTVQKPGNMMQGVVKRWLGDRGFGFIEPAAGGHDVFVHVSGLLNGVEEPREGQKVSFDEEPDRRTGKIRAANVVVL